MPNSESSTVEFKEEHSNTFLKTVSAYANYGTGMVYFGVNDQGAAVGLRDPRQLLLKIEQQINDTIVPRPRYEIDLLEGDVIRLKVFDGPDKPYQYQGRAYRRGGTSTVEVDRSELQHLFLKGANRSYDELPANVRNLSFEILGRALREAKNLTSFTDDTLRTLGLRTDGDEFNQAALLLADRNSSSGIEVVRYGDSINDIRQRKDLSGESIVKQFQSSVRIFEDFYCFERVDGIVRTEHELIPRTAFREAVANALAHRDWSLPGMVRISMFDDRVEVVSPGALVQGITEEEYLERLYSLPRNPLIVNVFRLLGYIEGLGTGVARIRQAYAANVKMPQFEVSSSYIKVVLPIVSELEGNVKSVLDVMGVEEWRRADLEKMTGLSKATLLRALGELERAGLIKQIGRGPSTRYRKV